jgi:amino acid transporter
MLLIVLLGLCLTMVVSRGTPVGAKLHRWLVEAPADRLSRISRGQLLFMLLTLSIIVSLVCLLENDGRMLVTMGLPEFLGFATAIDLSALLDLAAVAVIAAATIRVRTIGTWLNHKIAPRRPRARRTRVQRLRPPANDDERRPALAA